MRVVNLDLEVRPYARPAQVRINTSGNPCRVPHCDMLAGDGYICPSCVEAWEVNLGNITALVEDLEVAERKAVRFAPAGGSKIDPDIPLDDEDRILFADPKRPVPADEQTFGPGDAAKKPRFREWEARVTPGNRTASAALAALRDELAGQIRIICDTGHIHIPDLRNNPVAMSRWLLRQSARLPKLAEDVGWGLVHDLDQTVRDCLTVIDAPARRKYVRECEACSLAVWARGEQETARCACGAEYDVAAEHEARMEIARDAWVTIQEASDSSGVRLGTIRQWVDRGRVEAHGEPRRVRYGDVLDRAEKMKERSA